MDEQALDKDFLEYVVASVVEYPEDVVIDRKLDELGVLLTLTVNQSDMGRVIGKEGRTAQALRTLLRAIGLKTNARINLKINEPEGDESAPVVAADPDSAMDEIREMGSE